MVTFVKITINCSSTIRSDFAGMRLWTSSSFIQGMAHQLVSTKQLQMLSLTNCGGICIKIQNFSSKTLWKCRLQDAGNFAQTLMYWNLGIGTQLHPRSALWRHDMETIYGFELELACKFATAERTFATVNFHFQDIILIILLHGVTRNSSHYHYNQHQITVLKNVIGPLCVRPSATEVTSKDVGKATYTCTRDQFSIKMPSYQYRKS